MARRSRAAQRSRGASGIALLLGYPERGEDDAVYNAVQLIDRDGSSLANYRKCHLFGDLDRGMFHAGSGLSEVVELDGVRIGLLICYDVEFPESVRLLALAGADLVAVPTALMDPFEAVARILVPARALENQVFLAYANRCGREGDLRYCGLSCVVGPDGADLARAGRGEQLILADLDLARLAASRLANSYLADRRPELYGPIAAKHAGREMPDRRRREGRGPTAIRSPAAAPLSRIAAAVYSLNARAGGGRHARQLPGDLRPVTAGS